MNLEERLRILASVPEFRGMPDAARATLAAALREERFAAGEVVIEAGEHADRVFILAAGLLEVTPPGREQTKRRLERGALLGELAFFASDLRTATVTAASDCVLLSLPYENFRSFLIANPESALVLTGRIVRTLREIEAELAQRQAG